MVLADNYHLPQEGVEKAAESRKRQVEDAATIQLNADQVTGRCPSHLSDARADSFALYPQLALRSRILDFSTRRGCTYRRRLSTAWRF